MNAENFIARQSVIKQTHRNSLKRRTRRLGSVTFQIAERRGAWNKWCQLFYTLAQQLLLCSSSTSSFSLLVPFLLTFLLHISRHFPHFLERLAAQISHVFDGVRKHTDTPLLVVIEPSNQYSREELPKIGGKKKARICVRQGVGYIGSLALLAADRRYVVRQTLFRNKRANKGNMYY